MGGRILIVDDISTNRIVLKVKLAAAFYDTFQAANGTDALTLARALKPDLVLLDIDLPDLDGPKVCRALKSDPDTAQIPVVMISSAHNDEARLDALRAGAEDVFWKPFDDHVLQARIRSILRAREAEDDLGLKQLAAQDFALAEAPEPFAGQATVALVAEDPATAISWKARLAGEIDGQIRITDPRATFASPPIAVAGAAPAGADLYVVAADLDRKGDGLRFLSELRSRQQTRHAAVVIVLQGESGDTAAMALDLGANDVIPANVEPAEFALRVRTQLARKAQADRLRSSVSDRLRLSVVDPLTGLHNRRYAIPHLSSIAKSAIGTDRNFAVMILDLDRFKRINDTWGHTAGDAVLVEVAARLKANLRAVDLIARIGGEEFLVGLPDTVPEAVQRTAERLREVIQREKFVLADATGVAVTVSIGVAIGSAADAGEAGVRALIEKADMALLDSKAEGRNVVTIRRSAA